MAKILMKNLYGKLTIFRMSLWVYQLLKNIFSLSIRFENCPGHPNIIYRNDYTLDIILN